MSEPKTGRPPSSEAPLLRAHMPELDAIRGLAILGVVCYHGFYWAVALDAYSSWQRIFLKTMSVGQYGVNLFFILSGFLITGILLDTRHREDYYKRFYLRRALRILPAYYLTLLILVVFGLTTKGFLWMSLLCSSNLAPIFGISMAYPVLWSLAVEEHFYLVWPLAVKRISPRGLLGLAISLMVLSPALRYCCSLLPAKYGAIVRGCSYYTWNCFDGLALGAVMALMARRMNDNRRRFLRFSLALIGIGLAIAVVGLPFGITTRMNPVGEALQWVPWQFGLAGMLGIFVVAGSGKWRGLVAPRILTFIGTISYGVYLYHLLSSMAYHWVAKRTGFDQHWNLDLWERTWLEIAVWGTGAVALAYLSRWYFEEPFLRLKDRWGKTVESTDAGKLATVSEATSLLKP
jgi:peptidoglycan/LPS O-acetylase OafA/YrhL